MELIIDTTQAFYLCIRDTGVEGQLLVVTAIDGKREDKIVDVHTDKLDFFNKSGNQIAKLRFKS